MGKKNEKIVQKEIFESELHKYYIAKTQERTK